MNLSLEIKHDFDAIEGALKDNLHSNEAVAREICGHLLFSPGKRIRPLLTVLCARLGGNESQSLKLAAAVEYLHAATLMHDDILDEALLRRGKTATHLIWGNACTILGGDFLLARAVTLVAGLNNGAIMQKFAYFAERIIEGEIKEILCQNRIDLSIDEYFQIIKGKTAYLFQAACESGGGLGGLQPQQIVVLGEYGLNLGLAFQIEDDIMDYVGQSSKQGKLKGNDLREGKATLPLILALKNAGSGIPKDIENIFMAKSINPEHLSMVCNFIETNHGFSEAGGMARTYIDNARNALQTLPETKTKNILTELAGQVLATGH